MAGNPLTLQVGQKSTATVVVLDQFGQPMPFDFVANPPSFSIDQPTMVAISAGPTPDQEVVAGLAVTSTPANFSVSVPTVVNPTDTEQITVVAATQVATSVKITFSPAA